MAKVAGGAARATEGWFKGRDGVELFERSWELDSPKAALVIVHGFAEHCARYDHVAARLNGEGYSVYSYDQRGHGRSPGKMGYVNSFDRLLDDLDVFIARARARAASVPLFLMGHSMGGLVLASYVVRYRPDVRGLVFSGSGVKVPDNVSPITVKLSGILSALTPWLPVHQLEADAISRDPQEVAKYKEDPLVYTGKILARTGAELMNATKDLAPKFSEITLPFIALHGTGDRLVESEASQMLYDRAGAEDKTLKLYEGAYHEVFNDHDRVQFMNDMIDWLNAHCSR